MLNKQNKDKTKVKENKLFTLEETQYLCNKIIKKMKYTLELVKAATTGE